MHRLTTLALLCFITTPYADDWGALATISSTMGVQGGKLCLGEASRGDIGCPTYAPSVSPTGTLTTTAISLTTSGTNWGYLGSSTSYLPNLTSNAISTTNISISTINGISATSFGDSPVAFSVHKNGASQTIPSTIPTKMTWSTEDFDTNANFASDTFTATVAGTYQFNTGVFCSGGTICYVMLYKNGANVYQSAGSLSNSAGNYALLSHILRLNAGDTVEVYAQNTGGTAIHGGVYVTRFSGALINAVGGSGGDGTPTGQIAAFDLATCPTGWSEYTPARGRFLRGIDSTGTNDSVRTAGNTQDDAFKSHTHWTGVNSASVNSFSLKQETGSYSPSVYGSIGAGAGTGSSANQWNWINNPTGSGAETRPKNVAVLFCRKD